MRTSRKAIAIDLDGTLLRTDRTVSAFNIDMLQRCTACGWAIIIATARPVRSIRRLLPEEFSQHYWAALNGAWMVRYGDILARDEIAEETAREIVELCLRQGYRFSIEANDRLYSNISNASFIGPTYAIEDFTLQPIGKFLIDAGQAFNEETFRRLVPESCHYVLTDNGKLVQLMSKSCTKLTAVRHIVAMEDILLDDVVAFGDDNNDIPLLKAAGLGVAMGNATPELKAVADIVVKSNDEDGVGIVLEQLLLKFSKGI